jgi:hypothetical protein
MWNTRWRPCTINVRSDLHLLVLQGRLATTAPAPRKASVQEVARAAARVAVVTRRRLQHEQLLERLWPLHADRVARLAVPRLRHQVLHDEPPVRPGFPNWTIVCNYKPPGQLRRPAALLTRDANERGRRPLHFAGFPLLDRGLCLAAETHLGRSTISPSCFVLRRRGERKRYSPKRDRPVGVPNHKAAITPGPCLPTGIYRTSELTAAPPRTIAAIALGVSGPAGGAHRARRLVRLVFALRGEMWGAHDPGWTAGDGGANRIRRPRGGPP